MQDAKPGKAGREARKILRLYAERAMLRYQNQTIRKISALLTRARRASALQMRVNSAIV
jgi:hypothetical protein